ncbi:hypothetical protein FRC10_003876 [Ceratobasidium sp. 414]|nr:hypothetical protein FRC10_003876 [Ceratobasidium sp. 414]
MSAVLSSLISALLFSQGALAVGTAFGYAVGTTGGGSATPAIPSSTAQLVSWLGDSSSRVILLDRTYDFTDTEGNVTAKACKPWACSPNPQFAIDANEWCEHYEPNAAMTTVTYKKAGVSAILVGSNKTLLGKGTAGIMPEHLFSKGKGLRIAGGSNIIIQNIRISDINAQFVWGGDAISIDGGSKVWRYQFKNVGRQFVVTGYGAAKSVTISDNVFDGSSQYSINVVTSLLLALLATTATIGLHCLPVPKILLLLPATILPTLWKWCPKRECFRGRGPKLGGMSSYTREYPQPICYLSAESQFSLVDYFVDITGHALDAGVGSRALMEGNYFNQVTQPAISGTSGVAFAAVDSTHAAQCSSYLGRNSKARSSLSSGTLDRNDLGTLPYFKGVSAVAGATIMDPSLVGAYVQAHAGTGKVN